MRDFQIEWNTKRGVSFVSSSPAPGKYIRVLPKPHNRKTFELPTSEIRPYAHGTHEIMLMFEVFKPRRREMSPRYY